MKQFIYVLFGGLAIILVTVFFSVGLHKLYLHFKPAIFDIANKIINEKANKGKTSLTDDTSIAGMKRLVRYTASEEEGLLTNALISLPPTTSKTINAESYILKDIKTGKIITSKDYERRLPIASLTKLMTAVVAKRYIKQDKRVTISREIISTYGNTAGFKIGEVFYAQDLLYPLLMVSSNDAAEALARTYGRRQFIQAMNDMAQNMGAYRTTFVDPSGLRADNKSTVDDLATILEWIYKNEPDIIAITTLKSKSIRYHTWTNPLHFLSWSTYRGGKNGFTDEALQTALGLFEMGKDKDLYVVAVLGTEERDSDVVKLLGRVK